MLRPFKEKILFEGDTDHDHYQVIDMVYDNRKSRVLFSGDRTAAFSGMPLDGGHELLFDYIRRLFELVSQVRPRRLLLIGGGVYTLPSALIHALPDICIDVVEIDPGLDKLAESFFNFTPHERLRLIHADGKDYLAQTDTTYDMIIVDAFTELHIPESLAAIDTPPLIASRLTKNGIVAMNIISAYQGRSAWLIQRFYNMYQPLFKHLAVYPADSATSPWMSQNLILLGQKSKRSSHYGLRFEAITVHPSAI